MKKRIWTKNNTPKSMENMKEIFDLYIDNSGRPNFILEKIEYDVYLDTRVQIGSSNGERGTGSYYLSLVSLNKDVRNQYIRDWRSQYGHL